MENPITPTTPTPARNILLGSIGEELAANYLVKHGFRLLDRNWKSKYHYELDIVAFKDNLLHIVEVKTRQANFLVDPQRAIDRRKLERLTRGAMLYKKMHHLDFDMVIDGIRIVYRNEEDYDLTFLPNMNESLMFDRFVRYGRR